MTFGIVAVFIVLGFWTWYQIPPESDEIKAIRDHFGKALDDHEPSIGENV